MLYDLHPPPLTGGLDASSFSTVPGSFIFY